jgi:hypothetical protein
MREFGGRIAAAGGVLRSYEADSKSLQRGARAIGRRAGGSRGGC